MLTTGDFKKVPPARGRRALHPPRVLRADPPPAAATWSGPAAEHHHRRAPGRTFKAGEKFDEPDVQFRSPVPVTPTARRFTSWTGELRQHALQLTLWATTPLAGDGMQVYAVIYNGRMVGVDLPPHVEIEVSSPAGQQERHRRGKTLKDAELANGLTIKVPCSSRPASGFLVDRRRASSSAREVMRWCQAFDRCMRRPCNIECLTRSIT